MSLAKVSIHTYHQILWQEEKPQELCHPDRARLYLQLYCLGWKLELRRQRWRQSCWMSREINAFMVHGVFRSSSPFPCMSWLAFTESGTCWEYWLSFTSFSRKAWKVLILQTKMQTSQAICSKSHNTLKRYTLKCFLSFMLQKNTVVRRQSCKASPSGCPTWKQFISLIPTFHTILSLSTWH